MCFLYSLPLCAGLWNPGRSVRCFVIASDLIIRLTDTVLVLYRAPKPFTYLFLTCHCFFRLDNNELRRFYVAAHGDFPCFLSSVKKTILWRESYGLFTSEELQTWSNLLFWHGYDLRFRPCLIVRLGLAFATLPPHERPRFSQAVSMFLLPWQLTEPFMLSFHRILMNRIMNPFSFL